MRAGDHTAKSVVLNTFVAALRRHGMRALNPIEMPFSKLKAYCARPQNEQFRACAAGSAASRVPSLSAKLPIISGIQAYA
jgi:hypothetical protein